MSRVYEIADQYVERYAALNPIAATGMGVPGHDAEMTDFSPEGSEARAALSRQTRDALLAAAVDSERDRVARETMLERLELGIEMHEAGEELRELNILASPLQRIRGCFDLMPRESVEHWRNIATRMRLLPTALARYRQTLDEGVRRGLVSTQRQARECATQCAVWSGRREGSRSFFASLVDAYDAAGLDDGPVRVELEQAARTAGDAYAEMGVYLGGRYASSAAAQDAVGRDRYALGVRAFNGTELDAEETYRWGWEELYRVERALAETAERIAPGEGVEAAKQHLETDRARAIEGVEEFRRWMQELQDSTIADLHGVHFDIPEPVRRIEAMIAPPGGALAMYYTGPSEDFSRPGRTWYPTGGKTRFPLWREVSIAYHEGVPGHHLQIGTTRYLGEQLSRFQRLMGGTSGYVEGWALYAERLMHELGYLDDPGSYMGLLASQALRCARVVVDIGMHLELPIPKEERYHGGETWIPELALPFLEQRSHFPADFLASEVTRYLGIPGQAISYKVGERQWLEAREQARAQQGGDFDLKAWHARALDLGPMGLAQMQRELGGGGD